MKSLVDTTSINRLLCIGAHPDDIEIGAGGLIARLVRENPALRVHWVVFCGTEAERAAEARRAALLFADNGAVEVDVHSFRDAYLPWQGGEVKAVFDNLKHAFEPDLVLTHHRQDRHQDHQLLAELSWNTWRDHTILEYEILKYEGDLGQPNLYLPLTEAQARDKARKLHEAYPSQHARRWFDQEVFLALMRVRGVECNVDFAEAFHATKLVL